MSNDRPSWIITFSVIGIFALGGLVLWRMSTRSQLTLSKPKSSVSQKSVQPILVSKRVPTTPDPDRPPEKTDPVAQKGLGARFDQAKDHQVRRVVELPKDLSLREQVITLRGGEWQLRITVSLSSDDPQFVRRAAPLRGRLIEMLYFLVSHRVPESLRTPSGEDRLRSDLRIRYTNLLRTQDFDLYFDSLSLEAKESFEEDEMAIDEKDL